MVKEYRGSNTLIEPPPEGWATIIYADGYQAQVGGAKVINVEGKEMVRLYLSPFPATIRRFDIDIKKILDNNGYVYKWYPKEFVKPLNLYDPARRVFFCMLNWDGEETDSTKWFVGKEQAEEIIRLREESRQLRAYNEKLKEENFMMKANVQKYIKENMAESLRMFMPAIRSLVTGTEQQPTG